MEVSSIPERWHQCRTFFSIQSYSWKHPLCTALWEVNLQLPWSVKADYFYDLHVKYFSQISSKLHHGYTQTCSDKSQWVMSQSLCPSFIYSLWTCVWQTSEKGLNSLTGALMHGLRSMAGMTRDRSRVQRKHREARGYFTVHEYPQG